MGGTLAAMVLALEAVMAQEAQPAVVQKELVYKKTPTRDLAMVVHYPPDWKAADRRPAIVFFFGGGWRTRNLGQFTTQADALARLGLVAIRADYRLTGEDKVDIAALVGDARSAVRYVRRRAADLGVDPDRIVGAGGSSGGHLAASAAIVEVPDPPGEDAAVSPRPNLLVLFNPVLNLAEFRGGAAAEGGEPAKHLSPGFHVTKETPPAIIFFGTEDPLIQTAHDYVAAARQAGAPADLVTYDGQRHGFFNKEPYRTRTLEAAVAFLRRHGYLPKAAQAVRGD